VTDRQRGIYFKFFCLGFLFFAPLASQAATLSTATSAHPPTIARIQVVGNHFVPSVVILNQLEEKVGQAFSLRKVRMDIRHLFSTGNFKNIQVYAEPWMNHNEIVLKYIVTERPRISSITFSGNKKWSAHQLLSTLKSISNEPTGIIKLSSKHNNLKSQLKTNFYLDQPLDPAAILQYVFAIKQKYHNAGYNGIQVHVQKKLNTSTNTVQLIFKINEGNIIRVGAIKLIGVNHFSFDKILSQMKKLHKGQIFKSNMLAKDLNRIETFYHDHGYLHAVILHHQLEYQHDLVNISITVYEGTQYHLGEISIFGNTLFSDSKIEKAFGIKSGALLKKNLLQQGVRNIQKLYANQGYIFSVVQKKLTFNKTLKITNVKLNISEGQIAYVQAIKIVGNYKTKDFVIRREIVLKPGEKFIASKVRESIENIYNLGFFSSVTPEVVPGSTPGNEILIFRVQERKTGSISVGGGYSSVEQLVGDVSFTEADFRGMGQNLSISGTFGALEVSYSLSFQEPWLFNTPTSFGFSLFNTTNILLNYYTEKSEGGSISLGRKLSRYWTWNNTYLAEKVIINSVQPPYNSPSDPQYIPNSVQTTSSLTTQLTYDSRNNYFYPTRGWVDAISLEGAGGPLGLQTNFYEITLNVSHFISIYGPLVFAQHLEGGLAGGYSWAGSYTQVPIYDKFYCGGADSVRGYDDMSIGPANGGDVLFVSNTELHFPIAGPLKGVLFFDAGDAWAHFYDVTNTIQCGAGPGVRLTIPGTIMVIRLDYGWGIDSTIAPKGGRLDFSLGNLF
jgi:outer membrane protein insertion porin family